MFEEVMNILRGMFGAENSIWSDILAMFGEQVSGLVRTILPYAGLLGCLLLVLCGKKLLPTVKVLACFVLAFFASMYWLVPPMARVFETLPAAIQPYAPLIVAGIVGLIAACLGRFLYVLVYIGVFGGGFFVVAYSGMIVNDLFGIPVTGNIIVCGVAALVVMGIALLLRKFIEKLLTSAGGAYGFVFILVKKIPFAISAFNAAIQALSGVGGIGAYAGYLPYLVALILAIIGLCIQIKGDKKYKI